MTTSFSPVASTRLVLDFVPTPQNSAPVFGQGSPGFIYFPTDASDPAIKILRQADGRILIAGHSNDGTGSFVLHRLNADGTPDTTFGVNGQATAQLTTNASLSGLAFAPDGSIYVSGSTVRTGSGFQEFAIAHFSASGLLDTGFDTDGVALTAIGARSDGGRTILVQPDGKVIVGGYATMSSSSTNGTYRDFALIRYNADGSLDTSFDGDGIATTALAGNSFDTITSLAPLAGGQFLALGSQSGLPGGGVNAVLARYNADGSIDTTFATGGFVTTALANSNNGLATTSLLIDTAGRILVTGQEDRGLGDGSTTPFILRFNADGTPDTTFGGDGKVSTEIGTFIDNAYKIVQQADGKLLVAGLSFYTDSTNHGVLLRYNTDGSLDTSFGVDGLVRSPFPNPSDDSFQDVVLQADGKIVVTGFRGPAGDPDMVVVRYNADGSLDMTFDAVTTLDGSAAYTEGARPVVLDSSNGIYDAELSALGSYSGATLTIARHDAPNAQDVFGASGDVALATGNIVAHGTTIGTFTNADGTLTLHFSEGSTQSLVNLVLSSITYANTSSTPPASVTIDWTFNDGNTGAQGAGGAAQTTGSTTVTITDINNDPITPTPGNHDLEGTPGDDTFVSGSGRDTMTGGSGDDTYVVNNTGDRVIEGANGGDDTIETRVSYTLPDNVENLTLLRSVKGIGNDLDNVITGSDGKNDIVGGDGADTLMGGDGADRFFLNAVDESPAVSGQWDVITDFSSADGDKLMLRHIDANTARYGNQAFTFIGSAEFSDNSAGQLRFDPATHMLYGSVDADSTPEFAIELTGVTTLSARDIEL